MSLIFRDKVQPYLNGVDLHEYHAEIDHNKRPTIVGECGKPLFTLHGVTFSRITPTIAEMDIAVDLVNAFLKRHGGSIDLLLESQVERAKAQKKLSALTKANPRFMIDTNGGGCWSSYENTVKWKTEDSDTGCSFNMVYPKNDTSQKPVVTAKLEAQVTVASSSKVVDLVQADVNTARKILNAKHALKLAETKESEATTALHSCKV